MARLLGMMCRRMDPTPQGQTWKVDCVIEALRDKSPRLSWAKVAEASALPPPPCVLAGPAAHMASPCPPQALDHEGFLVPDPRAFAFLGISFRLGSREPFPLASVSGRVWSNTMGQLSFLRFAVEAQPELFTFEHAARKAMPLEGLHGGKSGLGTPNQAWLSLDLLEVLCKLAERGHLPQVRMILEPAVKLAPEVLLSSIAASQAEPTNELLREVMVALVPAFLLNHPNCLLVMHRVWPLRKEMVLQIMIDLYSKDSTSMSRILDVCQDLKATVEVLESTPFPFAIELACLASRREFLDLEKWLRKSIVAHRAAFVRACLRFLEGKTMPDGGPRINLSQQSLQVLLSLMEASQQLFEPADSELYQQVVQRAASGIATGPELVHPAGAASPAVMGPLSQPGSAGATVSGSQFPPDVEKITNEFFEALYSDKTPREEMILLLKRLALSGNPREQSVLQCIMFSLYEECKNGYVKNYPPDYLVVTAQLVGLIILHEVFQNPTQLVHFLDIVMSMLKCPPQLQPNLFVFGREAVTTFKDKLKIPPTPENPVWWAILPFSAP